jgi:hypothetical protein
MIFSIIPDEHPQKLANDLLAEAKRRALMEHVWDEEDEVGTIGDEDDDGAAVIERSSRAMMSNYGIVENSRPSTPSIPDEARHRELEETVCVHEEPLAKKRLKIKKKKKERSRGALPPAPPLNPMLARLSQLASLETSFTPGMNIVHTEEGLQTIPESYQMEPSFSGHLPQVATPTTPSFPAIAGRLDPSRPRWSTGAGENSSETEAGLKRSKRKRIPNKFYGYSSDEEDPNAVAGGAVAGTGVNALFKPTPPPNLTWCKEDLPSPPGVVMGQQVPKLKIRSPALAPVTPVMRRNSESSTKRRSSSQSSSKKRRTRESSPNYGAANPEPLHIPSVAPVHHLTPTAEEQYDSGQNLFNTSVEDESNDSDSSANTLQIIQEMPKIPKLKINIGTPKAVTPPNRNKKRKRFSLGEGSKSAKIRKTHRQPQRPILFPSTSMSAAPPAFTSPPAQLMNQPLPSPPTPSQTLLLNHQQHHNAIVARDNPYLPAPNAGSSTFAQYYPTHNLRYPPPSSWRPAREGESVYCYCRCPYDEVSEMIACDGDNCTIEWFHFECVGILMAPKGKWYCPECKPSYAHQLNQSSDSDDDEPAAAPAQRLAQPPRLGNHQY